MKILKNGPLRTLSFEIPVEIEKDGKTYKGIIYNTDDSVEYHFYDGEDLEFSDDEHDELLALLDEDPPLKKERDELLTALRRVSDWHEHAAGCPKSETEPVVDAACDCGLDALHKVLAKAAKEGK